MSNTFKLDTTGEVTRVYGLPFCGAKAADVMWSDLTPFAQGYIEAMARTFHDRALWGGMRFADLAPETLARIITDCETAQRLCPDERDAEHGQFFWRACAVAGTRARLGDDGKVRFA